MVIKVSVVEDDGQTRQILAGWISGGPRFRLVGEWGDAESAVAGLTGKRPDVVLMDINLPGMSGVEAVRRLKPLMPETQFVMLTVCEDSEHIYITEEGQCRTIAGHGSFRHVDGGQREGDLTRSYSS